MPLSVAAAIAMLAGPALPAAAAATATTAPRWRVSTTVGPDNGATYPSALVVTGPQDAWSAWGDCSPCSGPHAATAHWIERWSGRRWFKAAIPARLARYVNTEVAIGASSSRDAWVFDGAQVSGRALHWNGTRWAVVQIPGWVVRGNLSGTVSLAVADFGPAGMWVFSLGQESFTPVTSFAARYYRGHWSKVSLPGIPASVSALSPADIWAQFAPSSLPKSPRDFLARWDGRHWHRLAIPQPVKPRPGAAYNTGGLVAGSVHSVWLHRDILIGSQGARTQYLLHWNGARWQRVGLGEPISVVDVMAVDGHGGLWLADNGPAPGYGWYFDHHNGAAWTRTSLPVTAATPAGQVLMMSWVPGTRSEWAMGNLYPAGSSSTVLGGIWRYGP